MPLSLKVWGLFRTVDGQLELAKGTLSGSSREAKRYRKAHPGYRVMRYGVHWNGLGVRVVHPLGLVFMQEAMYKELAILEVAEGVIKDRLPLLQRLSEG